MIQARPEIFVSSIIPKVRESWLIRRLSPNTKYLCAGTLVVVKKSSNVKSVVLELVDARLPESSRNPQLKDLLQDKPSIIVLTKMDLADPKETRKSCDQGTIE